MQPEVTMPDAEISRILHFVIDKNPNPRCRPGIVVEDHLPNNPLALVNLVVFLDGSNDSPWGIDKHRHDNNAPSANLINCTHWEPSITPNHLVRVVGTWHWPRECGSLVNPAEPFTDDERRRVFHMHVEGIRDLNHCTACIAEAEYVRNARK